MRITKIHNNNIASVVDEGGNEVIVLGSGVSFHKKPGDLIDETRVEKEFVLKDLNRLKKLENQMSGISYETLLAAGEIVKLIESSNSAGLEAGFYFALAEHIQFAIDRIRAGVQIENLILVDDIKCFYAKEYKLALKALDIIHEKTGVVMAKEEAGFIAIYVLNASGKSTIHDSVVIVEFVSDVFGIIEQQLGKTLNRDTAAFYRLASHLKMLAYNLFSSKEQQKQTQDVKGQKSLCNTLGREYPKMLECTRAITEYISLRYNTTLSEIETIHLLLYMLPVVDTT
jgi:beta-glucoside operon transcriptional antiterminator